MHINFITVGAIHDVNRFIEELSAKYLPFKFFDTDEKGNFKKGTERMYHQQTIVRPIQLWDVVVAKENRDLMLNTIFEDSQGKAVFHGNRGSGMQKYLWGLRKAMKLKPIPKYDTSRKLPVYKANTHFIGLGVRDDRHEEDKEML